MTISFPYIFIAKTAENGLSAFFLELCENRSSDFNFDPKFGISAQKPIRTTIWRFWVIFHPENCYTVLITHLRRAISKNIRVVYINEYQAML